MPRPSDKERLMWLLQEKGGTSNQQVRSVLDLSQERYKTVRDELISAGLVEKFRCRGGGILLTAKGTKQKAAPDAKSSVGKENELYTPFADALTAEANENEEEAIVFDTSSLRKSGKWSNPDLTKISIRSFPILRVNKVVLTTYELKQWGRWNLEAAFEAASHRNFAHQSYVALEWAKDFPVEGLDEITQACGRFGVGLMTLHPYYTKWRHVVQLEAAPYAPSEDFVEEYLGYVFEKQTGSRQKYDALWQAILASQATRVVGG
jgi:hypothetical protein